MDKLYSILSSGNLKVLLNVDFDWNLMRVDLSLHLVMIGVVNEANGLRLQLPAEDDESGLNHQFYDPSS